MSLKKNILANLGGKIWTLIIAFVSLPLYIRFSGIEGYGLIGFYSTLFATLYLFEFGISTTVNREIAKTLHIAEQFDDTRDLIRSFEVIYWSVGIILAIGIFFLAPFIAERWLRNEYIENEVVINSIILMGATIAFQWPVSLYSGGLMGLERQDILNILFSGFNTLKAIISILVLYFIPSDFIAFFIFQFIITVIYAVVILIVFWRIVPNGTRSPRFNPYALRKVWNFTIGVGATGIVTFLLSNLDKILLSNILTLTDFGYYNIANQVNIATRISSGAVFQAIFPRFSKLYVEQDYRKIVRLYHEGSQFISLIVFPVSVTFSFFSYEILYCWMQSKDIAESSAMIASILVAGSAFNAILGIPYDMTVAYGWSMFGLYQNIISVFIIVPLMLLLVSSYGATGAAMSWFFLNFCYFLVSPVIMARKILPKGEIAIWYLNDIGRPLFICILIVAFFRFIFPSNSSLCIQAIIILFVWITAQLLSFLSLPLMRKRIKNHIIFLLKGRLKKF